MNNDSTVWHSTSTGKNKWYRIFIGRVLGKVSVPVSVWAERNFNWPLVWLDTCCG